ncbi:hypothetical protein MGYG_04489 [Nannizzia gypsea CBS 118893]|uniref:Uncharacterized protein n=1 Tax=Arthroderma gypseum (strain ATCC MYA-4604 / CBS 118893) TaxID=535722 RepID=E4UT85_ARTGP|nr:hypothetical protein MGYG_04489 [Nannizzia gypsea CBS 118893]EFR01481.1 hypothetical protein MGYG_04489 [Nannizzia gypsea CBS 118893]
MMKPIFHILAILSLLFTLVLAGRQRPFTPSLGPGRKIDPAMLVGCCQPGYNKICRDGSEPNPYCGVGAVVSKYSSALNIHEAVRQVERAGGGNVRGNHKGSGRLGLVVIIGIH